MTEPVRPPPEQQTGASIDPFVGWRSWALLWIAPLLLVGPSLLPGMRFLPQLPVQHQPLAAENPAAQAATAVSANLLMQDRILPVLSDQVEIRRQVTQGTLPTWEPKLGLGVPLFGGTIAAPAYPPNWLSILLPPDVAAGWLALFCLLMGGAGVRALARRHGLSFGAAAVAVVGYQTSGWALANLHLPMKVDAAVWLPWCLWAAEGLVQGRRNAGWMLTLFTTLSFLAGFVPIALFCCVIVVGFGSARSVEGSCDRPLTTRLSQLMKVFGYLALGVAGASLQVLPTVEASDNSLRQSQSQERIAGQALPLGLAASLVVPDLFGSPQIPNPNPHPTAVWLAGSEDGHQLSTFNSLEWTAFAGLAIVILALVGLVSVPHRAWAPALLLGLAWGFAQGWPWLTRIYQLPGMNLGAPNRALAVQWFLWPWLAALGTQALLERRPRARVSLLGLATLFSLATAWFLIWFDPGLWAEELVAHSAARFQVTEEYAAQVMPEASRLAAGEQLQASAMRVLGAVLALLAAAWGTRPRKRHLASAWLHCLLVMALTLAPLMQDRPQLLVLPILLGLCYVAVTLGRDSSRQGAGHREVTHREAESPGPPLWQLLALLVGLEGASHGAPHLAPRQLHGAIFPASPALDAVATAAGDGRVLRLDESPGPVPADVVHLARPNLLQAYRICDLTPYYVFTPRTLVELFEALDPGTRYASMISSIPSAELLGHPILDVARVTAVVARRPLAHPRIQPVYSSSNFYVYHRTGAPPAVHLVEHAVEVLSDAEALALLASGSIDPRQTVLLTPGSSAVPPSSQATNPTRIEISRPSANRIDVQIEDSPGGWLVFHEQFYPGWRATIDGANASFIRVDHALRALPISSGPHQIVTTYAPPSLQIGSLISLLSIILAIWLSRRRPRGTAA